MASLRARLVYDLLMPLLSSKRRYDPARTAQSLAAEPRTPAPPPTAPDGVAIREEAVCGRPLYRLLPTAGPPRQALFYLHGGAFVNPITRYHWRLLTDLCRRLQAEIRVPLYPLAPETPIGRMLPHIQALYTALGSDQTGSDPNGGSDQAGSDPCGLIGDSAGAWLALALVRRLRDQGGSAASVPAVVLISPCLDLTLSAPESAVINRRDPMLDLAGIRQVLALAAAPQPVDDPALNLLQGDLSGLPPMLVLAGTRDIAYPDAGRLAAAVRAAGGAIEVVEGPGMAHVWPLLPVPEAAKARQAIVAFLQRTCPGGGDLG